MTRSTIRIAALPLAALVPLFAACADNSPSTVNAPAGASMASHSMVHGDQADALPDGDYEADLHVLNAGVQEHLDPDRADGARGVTRGKAFFTVKNGEFTAVVSAMGVEPNMIHPQHIHAAASCPPASADVNGDGFVDVIEGVPFYGPILIPLDDNLASQAAGAFPTAVGIQGLLNYTATTSLTALLNDLNAPDPDPTDAVVKLNGAPLALETRHVVIHGVDAHTPLPPTVASLPGVPAFLTLPVACGEIRRIR